MSDVTRIDSTPDHKPPSKDDTLEGRYASVLFTAASQKEALYEVLEDMRYLSQLYDNCESFRQFTENSGNGPKEVAKLNEALSETASIS